MTIQLATSVSSGALPLYMTMGMPTDLYAVNGYDSYSSPAPRNEVAPLQKSPGGITCVSVERCGGPGSGIHDRPSQKIGGLLTLGALSLLPALHAGAQDGSGSGVKSLIAYGGALITVLGVGLLLGHLSKKRSVNKIIEGEPVDVDELRGIINGKNRKKAQEALDTLMVLEYKELSRLNLSELSLEGADLSAVSLRNTDLRETNLRNANPSGTDLREINIDDRTDFKGSRLDRISFIKIVRKYTLSVGTAKLKGVNLAGQDLSELSYQYEVDLSGANLTGVNLSNTNLRKYKLQGAGLVGADLCGAKLPEDCSGIDFNKAIITKDQCEWIKTHKGNVKGALSISGREWN